jgi:hypothetical protein
MLAHALLAVIAAHEHTDRPATVGLIPLTCNEIRRLLTALVIEPSRTHACPKAWSDWRRRHQHRARTNQDNLVSDAGQVTYSGRPSRPGRRRSPPRRCRSRRRGSAPARRTRCPSCWV